MLLIALVFVLLWVAVRCRPVFAAATAFVVALAVFTSTTLNAGYFGDASIPLSDRILAAQILVLVGALLAFILAALFAERRQHEAMLKRSKERLQRVVAELDHRVKNVFATVSAVATHTLDASKSMDHFVAALDGRLRSMASTHELLSDGRWCGVNLSDLACRELAPYKLVSNSEVSGPEVMLSAEAGQALAMVLHELVTNAAKHGALSTREGRVSVRWHWPLNGSAPDRLILEWAETGGPSVKAPSRSGYGTSVIGDLIPYELGGKVDLAFACDGLRCRMEIPASWVSTSSTPTRKSVTWPNPRRSIELASSAPAWKQHQHQECASLGQPDNLRLISTALTEIGWAIQSLRVNCTCPPIAPQSITCLPYRKQNAGRGLIADLAAAKSGSD